MLTSLILPRGAPTRAHTRMRVSMFAYRGGCSAGGVPDVVYCNMAVRVQGQGELDLDEVMPAARNEVRANSAPINRCLFIAVNVLSLALVVVVGVLFKIQSDAAGLDKEVSVNSARLTALNETFGFCETENDKKAEWIDTLTTSGLIRDEVHRDCLQELDSSLERERRLGDEVTKLKSEQKTARLVNENLSVENDRLKQISARQHEEQLKLKQKSSNEPSSGGVFLAGVACTFFALFIIGVCIAMCEGKKM